MFLRCHVSLFWHFTTKFWVFVDYEPLLGFQDFFFCMGLSNIAYVKDF
jgi:hypothetical protein